MKIMQFKDIKTWVVADHKARPKNIYTNFHPVQHPGFPFDRSRKQWADFERESKDYICSVDETLLPGDYPAEMFGEPAWQVFIGENKWVNISNPNDYIPAKTRQYLQLKQPVNNPIKAISPQLEEDESKVVESVPVKSAEEIINYLVGLNGYPHLLSLLTRMPRSEQKQFIISCMESYASQFKTNPIEVIKKRIAELEAMQIEPPDETVELIRSVRIGELKNILLNLFNNEKTAYNICRCSQ